MKKVLCFILPLLLFCATAYAAQKIDLSAFSYAELVALKEQINLAIWNSKEWQEVEVPVGVWKVGEDIPAGKWTIKAADGLTTYIYWGDRLNEAGTEISFGGSLWEHAFLISKTRRNYEKGDTTEVTWNLKNGQYFIVESGIALFTPYAGKPDLGFK